MRTKMRWPLKALMIGIGTGAERYSLVSRNYQPRNELIAMGLLMEVDASTGRTELTARGKAEFMWWGPARLRGW